MTGGYHFRLLLALLTGLTLQVSWASAATLADSARAQIGVTKSYDPAYRKLSYPGGDVPKETGVCSDVIVRAFRGLKIDLQKEVHDDMLKAFDEYPRNWGLKSPDANIDHRRVPNLMTFFERQAWAVPMSKRHEDFKPGDVVAWNLGGGVTHIGIVSDRYSAAGTPLVIHNIGQGAREEDVLFRDELIGHYRPKLPVDRTTSPRRPHPPAS